MSVGVHSLRCEYVINPLGIDEREPRLSWRLLSDRRDTVQTAYRIQVAGSRDDLEAERALLWETAEVTSDRSTQVLYQGLALRSFQRCWWRVRVRDNYARWSEWSEPAFWEMGILEPEAWQARWITPDLEERETDNPCPMLRKEFVLSTPLRQARAYITALGLYECEINGRRVGDRRFTPGFTSYHKRLHYQVYDVTDLLSVGANAIGRQRHRSHTGGRLVPQSPLVPHQAQPVRSQTRAAGRDSRRLRRRTVRRHRQRRLVALRHRPAEVIGPLVW
jgi:alpha-L-rhamnosidase